MYFTSAAPWMLSLPITRCHVDQPDWVMVALVAEGEIDGRPAAKNVLPVASDSPEKPGPTRPMIELSWTILVASGVAFTGSPCESNTFRPTLQSLWALLYSSSASLMPPTMFWPSAPASPVVAPKKARL